MTDEIWITIVCSITSGIVGAFGMRIGHSNMIRDRHEKMVEEKHRLELQIKDLSNRVDKHEQVVGQVSGLLLAKLRELYSLEGKKDGNR